MYTVAQGELVSHKLSISPSIADDTLGTSSFRMKDGDWLSICQCSSSRL